MSYIESMSLYKHINILLCLYSCVILLPYELRERMCALSHDLHGYLCNSSGFWMKGFIKHSPYVAELGNNSHPWPSHYRYPFSHLWPWIEGLHILVWTKNDAIPWHGNLPNMTTLSFKVLWRIS